MDLTGSRSATGSNAAGYGRLMGSVSTDHDDGGRQRLALMSFMGRFTSSGGKTGRNESVELPARPFAADGGGELQPEVVVPILDTIVRHLEAAARR